MAEDDDQNGDEAAGPASLLPYDDWTEEALRHVVARALGYAGIVSARSGETEDTTIAHLAIGWGTGQLKVGSFARSERMAKWNEVLRIEEAMGHTGRFPGGSVLGRNPA